MIVTMDSEVAEDLIKFKLRSTKTTLEEILKSWNQNNAEDFIENVRNGTILEVNWMVSQLGNY